jgi:transcriptional regulator with XRE-family HTH domain
MNFGRILRRLRREKGVSIKQLAPAVGVSYTYISKLENSRVSPSPEVVERLSHYFDHDSDELMFAAGKIPKDIITILQSNPQEAASYLRKRFANAASK